MNRSIIRYIIGRILRIEGALLMLPVLAAIIYREPVIRFYLGTALICFVVGNLLSIKRPVNTVFYLKEGCVATALSWIVLSLSGAFPFFLTGEIPSFVDALFETVSGFTTTGASVLEDVEALSHASLLWRSFTHWVGGMGVLVFLLAIIPLSGGSNINLMRAESPGPAVGKLVPRIKGTARALYLIYIVMTVIEFALLVIGGMPVFDSVCMSFGTAGTGGFGILNSSAASYSLYARWVMTVFMILFGVNFNAYYLIIIREWKRALMMEELRAYLAIILCATVLITINIAGLYDSISDAVSHSAFQVASIITTTGFSTVDFDMWPTFSKMILVLLMFIGACAGSTGGGLKVSRIIVSVKTFFKEIYTYIHPKSVRRLQVDHHPLDHDTVRSVNTYLVAYILLFIISLLLVSVEGKDLTTTFTSIVATLNNIGPGLGLVGPVGNYSAFGVLSKVVLMIDMLAGRLELFPLFILFHPAVWKSFTERSHHGV